MAKKETSKKVATKEKTKKVVIEEDAKVEEVKTSETKVEKKKEKKQKGQNIFTKIVNYFKSVKIEMTKVKWPTKKEMALYSWATLVFIVIFALFFTLDDVIISAVKQLVR